MRIFSAAAALLVLGAVVGACGGGSSSDAGADAASGDGGAAIDASSDAGSDGGAIDDAAIDDAAIDDAAVDDAAVDDAAIDAAVTDDAAIDASSDAAPSDASFDGGDLDPGEDASVDAGPVDARSAESCGTVVETYPIAASPHVEMCSAITYATSPPTSGPHYPRWAAYRAYDAPIARGFMVHALEHGAVVVTYNCATACDDEIAALEAYVAALPPDPRCTTRTPHQIVIAPDPLLDVRFAAAAWGVALRSDCFDFPALGTFVAEHTAHAPEDTCYEGDDILDPTTGIPAGCGL